MSVAKKKPKKPIGHRNMAEFLRGQSSKIITSISNNDEVTFVAKNGKPIAVVISNDRYERLFALGIDLNDESTWGGEA